MDNNSEQEEERIFEAMYVPGKGKLLLIDIILFNSLLKPCLEAVSNQLKRRNIEKLLSSKEWHMHYRSRNSGNTVLAESGFMEHGHELRTACSLADQGYNVLFAPKGLFGRSDKRFDIYLIRNHVILQADLKYIQSKNPDTIANRIKGGSEQASRLVIEIASDIEKKFLIEGLRSGVYKNKLLKEILLFYKGRFYILPVNLITSKNIFTVIQ